MRIYGINPEIATDRERWSVVVKNADIVDGQEAFTTALEKVQVDLQYSKARWHEYEREGYHKYDRKIIYNNGQTSSLKPHH